MTEIDIKTAYPAFDSEQLGFIFGMIRARMMRPGMLKSQRAVAESVLEEIRKQWGTDAPLIEKMINDLTKCIDL